MFSFSPSLACVDVVVVPTRLRPLDQDKVRALAESIDAIGLQHPISVYYDDDNVVLVAGRHRLAAAQSLEWDDIPAIFLQLDDIDRRLWEIDENLQRANLTPAQEADHLKRRAELWGAREVSAQIGSKPHGGRPAGFASETAASTGKSKTTINRAKRRAEKIAPDVLGAVQGTELDKGVELDALAKMEPEEQRKAVAAVEAGDTDTVREKPTKAERERIQTFEQSIGGICGFGRGVIRLYIPYLTDEERQRLDSELHAAVRGIHALRKRIRKGEGGSLDRRAGGRSGW